MCIVITCFLFFVASSLLYVVGVIAHQWNAEVLLSFTVFEFNLLVLREEVVELDSILSKSVVISQFFCLDHAGDESVAAVSSCDYNINFPLVLVGLDFSGREGECSWEVLVKNGHTASGVVTSESLLGLGVVKFNMEVHVWLPLVVINDLNVNYLDLLLGLEVDDLVELFEVLSFDGGVSNGSDSDGVLLLVDVLGDCDLD